MPRAPKTEKPAAAENGSAKKVNGLTKPMTLSPALAAIVGAKKDEKLARSEIVKRLWAYLKAKNLQVLFFSFPRFFL
jgi:upstream activation factor subunit UAF30